jgi:cell division cycle 2-like protein
VPPRTRHPPIQPSRSVYSYEKLNQIEEGSYGVVFRARDQQTGDIVALKKLKLEEEKNGFPITALREIYSLMTCRHENVVGIREVVVGDTLTQCVSSLSTVFKSLCNHINLSIFAPLNWLLNAVKESSSSWTLSSTTSKPC